MSRYVSGLLMGAVVGVAAAAAANMWQPDMTRNIMRKGRCIAKRYRRKLKKMDMF